MNTDGVYNVAIIGAGPSGLSSAYNLHKKNYKDVIILEASSNVGGKADTMTIDGANYELGPTTVINYYENVMCLAKKFKQPLTPISGHEFCRHDINLFSYFLNPELGILFIFRFVIDLIKLIYISFQYRKFADSPVLYDIPDKFKCSVSDFIEQQNLYGIKNFLCIMCKLVVNGSPDKIPIAFVIKTVRFKLLTTFLFTRLFYFIVGHSNYTLKFGYQNLFVQLANYLELHGTEIKLNQNVTSVYTIDNVNFIEMSDGSIVKAHKVIIACLPKYVNVKSYIDGKNANDVITQYHDNINNITTSTLLCRLTKVNRTPRLYNPHFRVDEPLLAIDYNEKSNNNIVSIVFITDKTKLDDELLNDVKKFLAKNNLGTMVEVIKYKVCADYPLPNKHALNSQYYETLNSYQGLNNIYYSNIAFCLSYVEQVMSHSKYIADTYF